MAKRPIDALRDSAITIKLVGEDAGGVRDLCSLGKRLLAIHAKAIFEIKLPDQIDPERTNPALPPTYQLVLHAGAEDDDVARTFMQAIRLFRENYFIAGFDHIRAQEIALNGLHDLVSMRELSVVVAQQIKVASAEFMERQGRHGLPSLPGLRAQCEMFMHKARHLTACMRELSKLFAPDAVKAKDWPRSVATLVISKRGDMPEEMQQVWIRWAGFLAFIADARNAMEHPDDTKSFIVEPFTASKDGTVVMPSVQVIHPKRWLDPTPATQFLEYITDILRDCFETLIVGLADAHVVDFAGVETRVGMVDESQRGNRRERFAYFGNLNGRWTIYL